MKPTPLVLCAVSLALTVCLASFSPVRAAPHEAPGETGEAEMKKMSAEEKAMMDAWMKSMAPVDQHAVLAESAGTWTMKVETWMDPSGEPEVSTATSERTMIMGGRVLREEAQGTAMGMPFHGLGFTGYDTVTGEYWSSWMDNLGTGIAVSRGEWDEEKGEIAYEGTMSDPMSGELVTFWATHASTGKDQESFTMFQMIDGEKVRTMEITYTRQ